MPVLKQTTLRIVFILILFGFQIFGFQISQAADIMQQRVQFAEGEIGATLQNKIQGERLIDYKLRARAGQFMNIGLASDNPSNYFNVMAPGETDVAFFIGSRDGNEFEADLTKDGDYTIRIYLMRNAARRNESANFTLEVAIAAAGDVPSEASDGQAKKQYSDPVIIDDALVAGTEFHATGEIPCASSQGQPLGSCRFGVIRQGGGNATVRVFWGQGGERNLYFEDGKAVSSDAPFEAQRESDLNRISIGKDERFEVPDGVIYGG